MSYVERFSATQIGEILGAIKRHRISVALTFFGTVITILAVLILWPNSFISDAQLLVRLGRASVAMDPTSTITPTVSLQETRINQVASVREMLQSRLLAERVVDKVGVERVLAPQSLLEQTMESVQNALPKFERERGPEGEYSAEELKQMVRRELAVKKFQSKLFVVNPKNSYTISIEARSGSPFLAQELVKALLEEYRAYHVNAYTSGGSLDFFEEQARKTHEDAVAAQEKVRDIKNRIGVLDIESARAALRNEISLLERDQVQVDSEIAGIESELDNLDESLVTTPQRIDAETLSGITKQAGDGMRQQLFNLELQEQQLAARYTDSHPKVKAVREQLDASRKIATSERGEQPQTRETVNPVHQQLALTYRTTNARLSGLVAKRKAVKEQLADATRRLEKLNADAVELTQLTWEAQIAQEAYLKNAQSREQARLVAALDREQISDVSVVQPASLVLKKVSPPRSLMAVCGVFFAALLACVQAVLRSLMNQPERLQLETGRTVNHRGTSGGNGKPHRPASGLRPLEGGWIESDDFVRAPLNDRPASDIVIGVHRAH